MDTTSRSLKHFCSLAPGDKIPVLLAGPRIFDYLQDGSFQSIRDEAMLRNRIDSISKNLRSFKIDSWINAISAAVSGLVMTPDGLPGQISFPIFPFRAANKEKIRPIQYIERDSLTVDSFLRYFGMFKRVPSDLRPRIIFSVENSADGEEFFEGVRDTVDLYKIFPDGIHSVASNKSTEDPDFKFSYLSSGSTRNMTRLMCEYPSVGSNFISKKSAIIKNYFISMAKQHDSPSFSSSASRDVRRTLKYIDEIIVGERGSSVDFLLSAKIQFLLLKILIDDDDQDALYEALTLSKAIESQKYEIKCMRFANQISGVSSYALDQLTHSAKEILSLSRNEAFNPVHTLEYFAAKQNVFITRLFNRRDVIDISEADDCLGSAEDQCIYFSELGMLANSVAISHLCAGSFRKSCDIFEKAATYSSDRITNLNINMNFLISLHLNGNKAPTERLEMMFKEYKDLELNSKSQYHAAMMFGNIWKLAGSSDLKEEIEAESVKRKFIKNGESGEFIIPRLRKRGFLFMKEGAFSGQYGNILDTTGFMPAFHFNWSTPVVESSRL